MTSQHKTIAYTYAAVDIFHYGHLRLLESARAASDFHICGLLSDDVCRAWNGNLVMLYEERYAVLNALSCVDEVIQQTSPDPTENLKAIYREHPDAQLILFQGHQNWKNMPGVNFIHSIGGKVIRPDFYPRLSRTSVRDELNSHHTNGMRDLDGYLLGNVRQFSAGCSTKANTLMALQPVLTKSRIEQLFTFDTGQWRASPDDIVRRIQVEFEGPVVVRSSTRLEDSHNASYAGCFHSELNVMSESRAALVRAINNVLASYEKESPSTDDEQVLVQQQTSNVKYSGVLFTRNLNNNAPYYIINYDTSEQTDTVTGGSVGHRLEVARDVPPNNLSEPWNRLLEAVCELEELLDDLVLDVEFAVTIEGIVIFQVRPLAAVSRFKRVPDDEILRIKDGIKQTFIRYDSHDEKPLALSDMSFWNPAEIVGDRASPLAISLYRHLILHRAWNEALTPLGYRHVSGDLIVVIADKPYIDIRKACAALLPQGISTTTTNKLVDHYVAMLNERPALHDKIEFDLVHNVYGPNSQKRLSELSSVLDQQELGELRDCLVHLTTDVFARYDEFKSSDENSLRELSRRRDMHCTQAEEASLMESLQCAAQLLEDARRMGTPQFARMARMAFIGNQYLRELVEMGLIDRTGYESFVQSVDTVASQLDRDFCRTLSGKLSREEFLASYGHLRPGTYDIVKLPYSKTPAYFSGNSGGVSSDVLREGKPDSTIFESAKSYFAKFAIPMPADFLPRFVVETTQLRESFKFEFTKSLSAALEIIAHVGEELGFVRGDLAYLTVENVFGTTRSTGDRELRDSWSSQITGRRHIGSLYQYVSLPSLAFSAADFDLVRALDSQPNFITQQKIMAELIEAESLQLGEYDRVTGRVVLLERADPGYDWIFSKRIKGLVTRYGGVASHMAIRCAEFGLPAAIGCGETIFHALKSSKAIDLDCGSKRIRAIR